MHAIVGTPHRARPCSTTCCARGACSPTPGCGGSRSTSFTTRSSCATRRSRPGIAIRFPPRVKSRPWLDTTPGSPSTQRGLGVSFPTFGLEETRRCRPSRPWSRFRGRGTSGARSCASASAATNASRGLLGGHQRGATRRLDRAGRAGLELDPRTVLARPRQSAEPSSWSSPSTRSAETRKISGVPALVLRTRRALFRQP